MSVESYLELLDWTGGHFRAEKRSRIPVEMRPVLERLDHQIEAWVENVQRYGRLFRRRAQFRTPTKD